MIFHPAGMIGLFTDSPNAGLHLHTPAYVDTGINIGGPIKKIDIMYRNTFLMTNPTIGNSATDGFKITQTGSGITLMQQENAPFWIVGKDNKGLIIAPNGNITIGNNASYHPELNYQLYMEGRFYAENVEGKEFKILHRATSDWSYALKINTNRGLTKAIAVLDSTDTEVFRVYGNGIVYGKFLTTQRIKVNTGASNISWYDHVFSPDYELMPLQEVEQFVKENRHLPDIPSEAEIKEHGVDVVEIEALLLKKVEELTLYVIELEKQIRILQTEIKKGE